MAIAWSKTVPYNCYELGHCWTPSCKTSFTGLATDAFKYSLKVYGTLYLISAIVCRKKRDYYLKRFIPETVRSALFLATNGALFIGSFCVWRKIFPFYVFYNTFLVGIPISALMFQLERPNRYVFGKASFISTGFLPGLTASFLAIIMERKARRGMLALYLLNLAVETAFNSAVSKGLPRIQNGEVMLFSISMAIYCYLYKKNILNDNIKRLMGFFMGSSELPPSGQSPHPSGSNTIEDSAVHRDTNHRSNGVVSYLPKELKALITFWRNGPKHKLCRHQFSCLSSSVESGVRLFVAGYLVQAASKLFRALTKVFRNPRGLLKALTHKDNMNLGLFLASFTALMRICHCLLRWLRGKDSPLHGLVGGFVAGWSMLWYKSSSVAMWVTSKLVEILYFKGIEAGVFPYIKYGDVIIYSLSTAFVLHAAVFEPHNIRPAYWNFLLGLTNQKFSYMNRKLLDVYGTNASKLYPNYWPKYDSRCTPNL